MWNVFWNAYAAIYDSLGLLVPYQELVADMANMAEPCQGSLALDAGCGTGNLALALANRGVRVRGLDASAAMLSRAKRKLPESDFQQGDLSRTLPFEDDSFDLVTCCNVLYALPDPAATVREFHRVLKAGGRMIVSTPTENPDLSALIAAHFRSGTGPAHWWDCARLLPLVALLVLFNLVLLVSKDSPTIHFAQAEEIEGWCTSAGFHGVVRSTAYAGQNLLLRAAA